MLIVVIARSLRNRCFNLLLFINFSLLLFRSPGGHDPNHIIAHNINDIEQAPILSHANYRFSWFAFDDAGINHTEKGIEERLARRFK